MITKEECDSPRGGPTDFEAIITPITADSGRTVAPVTTSSSKVDTPLTTDLTITTKHPPYPRSLVETSMTSHMESDFLRELRNLHVQIPLLQAIRDVLVYAKIVRDLCIKKLGRKPKDPDTIHVMGNFSELMINKSHLSKYNDLGNRMVTIYIDDKPITNTLIDLGAAINVMTKELFITLGLHRIRNTPTMLELADRSCAKPKGMLEDIVITIDSWRYPIDYFTN